MLWQNLWSDEQMAAYQAMGQWTKDHVPFPGGTFRQLTQIMRDNAIINDTVMLGGTPVHLADIHCPFLSVLAERDHIAPRRQWLRSSALSAPRTSRKSGCQPGMWA